MESGTLPGPYSGQESDFARGPETSGEIQIDHVVALADAWGRGAQQWDDQTRTDFAHDPRNLPAVDGDLNQEKVAGDVTTWLPRDTEFRCNYAQWKIAVKASYDLSVTKAERDALERQLNTCDWAWRITFRPSIAAARPPDSLGQGQIPLLWQA